jgi:hypothetical protein
MVDPRPVVGVRTDPRTAVNYVRVIRRSCGRDAPSPI